MTKLRADPARSLVSMATRLLPAQRRDWGQAMQAEFDAVPGPWARWRFALGCARMALVAPRQAGGPALLVRVGLLAGAAVVGLGIYGLAPAMAAVIAPIPPITCPTKPCFASAPPPSRWKRRPNSVPAS